MAEICVIIARRRHLKVLEDIETAIAMGAKLLEVRFDYLTRPPRLREVLQAANGVPVIATVRRREDGGQWVGTEGARKALLRAAIVDGFDYVDLEFDVANEIPRFGATKRIVSYHETEGMPDALGELHEELAGRDADIVKIAGLAKSVSDNFEMFELLKLVKIPTIALCMGDLGLPSRVLGAKFGSPFSYAAFDEQRIVAPGMLTFEQMREQFDYERIGPQTEVYGVIGDPIAQSLSPVVHNTCFRERKLDKVYLPFRVPRESLEGFMHAISIAGIRGLSVTLPHKQSILAFGEPADSLVTLSRSANTVMDTDVGRQLYNTDGPAALAGIEAAIPPDPDTKTRSLAQKTALVIGTGGVARTMVFALRQRDMLITITGRNKDQAHQLAGEVGAVVLEWSQRNTKIFDVLVNATPIGMMPEPDEIPVHPSALHENMVVFDTVYNPENTLLIQAARERGCIPVTGVDMFVRQAERQFQLFTGQNPPNGLMDAIVREELSPARNMLREVRLSKAAAS